MAKDYQLSTKVTLSVPATNAMAPSTQMTLPTTFGLTTQAVSTLALAMQVLVFHFRLAVLLSTPRLITVESSKVELRLERHSIQPMLKPVTVYVSKVFAAQTLMEAQALHQVSLLESFLTLAKSHQVTTQLEQLLVLEP